MSDSSARQPSAYNGEIDVWKFLFAVVIFLFHSHVFCETPLPKGSICVEFFFIVSGFFLASSVLRHPGQSSAAMLWHKIAFVGRPYVISFAIAFAALHVMAEGPFDWFRWYRDLLGSSRELLMVQQSGILGEGSYNTATWYISAMILGMAVLLPLLRRFGRGFATVACPLLAVTCYAVVYNNCKKLTPFDWCFVTLSGTLRGIAGMALGVFLHELVGLRSRVSRGWARRIFRAVLKVLTVWALWHFMSGYFEYEYSENQTFSIVMLFFLLAYLVFSGRGLLCRLPAPVTRFLGATSLYLYLCHYVMVKILNILGKRGELDAWPESKAFTVYIAGTVLSMSACWGLVKAWELLERRCARQSRETV